MGKLPPDAQQHPDAWAEAVAIAEAGSYEHLNALAQFGRLFDRLFDAIDGDGAQTWLGASLTVSEFCRKVPGTSNPAIHAETFWGPGGEMGVVPSFAVLASGRPVLMAVVAFNGPRGTDAVDENVAKVLAVQRAESRSQDL